MFSEDNTTQPLGFSEQALDTIADGLNEQGYMILPHALVVS